jgi:hypothetical protein
MTQRTIQFEPPQATREERLANRPLPPLRDVHRLPTAATGALTATGVAE